jgi:hypothetical protein
MYVIIDGPATRITTDRTDGNTIVTTRTETTFEVERHIQTPNPNIDWYFRPDSLEEYAEFEVGEGDQLLPDLRQSTIVVEITKDDLIESAMIRAGEDSTTTAAVLDEWRRLEYAPSNTTDAYVHVRENGEPTEPREVR